MFSSTTDASFPPIPTTTTTTMSLTDREVLRLQELGDLTQVAGSQSLLTQELLDLSQQTLDENDDDGNDADDDANDDQSMPFVSTQVHAAMQRCGILAQDDGDDENQENAPANSQSQASSISTGTLKQMQQHQQQISQHQHSHHDATVNIGKDSTSATSVLVPLTLPLSFPMSLSQENEDTDGKFGGTAYDNTMDLVMEMDEAYTGLDAMKQAATVQQCKSKNPKYLLSALTSHSSSSKRNNKKRVLNTSNTNADQTPNVFGSLLDAVQVVQSQGVPQSQLPCLSPRLQKQRQQREHSMDPHMTTTGNMLFPPHSARVLSPEEVATGAINQKEKLQQQQGKQKAPASASNKNSVKRPILNAPVQQPFLLPTFAAKRQLVAQRAADLAVRVSSDADLAKRLLLSMALLRDNPRATPLPSPPPGHYLEDGFFWAHYPPLEQILKDNMARYYALSIGKCQSPEQHTFNNTLVVLIRKQVADREWSFDRIFMCNKVLRDRIRCYYKTHIQNAKKRLRTMLKNPTKNANANHLIQHWEQIRETIVHNQTMSTSTSTAISTSPSSTDDSGSSDENGEQKIAKKPESRRVTMEEATIAEIGMTRE